MKVRSHRLLPLLMLLAPPGQATVMLRLDLAEMTGRADQIFLGTATNSQSRWTADRRYIVTDTVFQVVQNIHGQTAKTVTVTRLGGSVDGIGMKVFGAPTFEPARQYVLFTEKRGGDRNVVGMQQGVFHVEKDVEGRLMVETHLGGLELMRRQPSGQLQLYSASTGPSTRSLEDFISVIQDTIQRCKSEPNLCRSH